MSKQIKIDPDRLVQIIETAHRLKAEWRGLYEGLRETQEQIQFVNRERRTAQMRLLDLQLKDDGQDAKYQAKLDHLRRIAETRQLDVDVAGEISNEAGLLAQACREYAAAQGLRLPADFEETGFYPRAMLS